MIDSCILCTTAHPDCITCTQLATGPSCTQCNPKFYHDSYGYCRSCKF